MAYGLIISSIEKEKLEAFQQQLSSLLETNKIGELENYLIQPSKLITTTHYFASAGTENKALDEVVGELFDGGVLLHEFFWHPYLPPRFHDQQKTKEITQKFSTVWSGFIETVPAQEKEWWEIDFHPILEVLKFAEEQEHIILVFMDKPFDKERADKVIYPIKINNEEEMN